MTPLQKQMILTQEAEKAKEALRLCVDELFSIHSQYGDKKNAIEHSVALRKAMEIIGDEIEDEIEKEIKNEIEDDRHFV